MIRVPLALAGVTALALTLLVAPATSPTATAATTQPAASKEVRYDLGGGWQLCLGDTCPDHAILDVSAGNATTCVVVAKASTAATRTVWCWGRSFHGNAGVFENVTGPINVPVPGNPSAVRVGADHTCAISDVGSSTGTVWCWGSNARGELGTPTVRLNQSTATPQQVVINGKPLTGAKDLHAGWNSTCALTTTVLCWGWSQGANWADTAIPRAFTVPSPKKFAATTGPGICLLTGDGLYCQSSGDAEYSRFDPRESAMDATACDSSGTCGGAAFRRKTGTGSSTTIAAAGRHRGCAVTSGVLGCWGSNASEVGPYDGSNDSANGVPGGVRVKPGQGKWDAKNRVVDGRLGAGSKALDERNPVKVLKAPSKITTLGSGAGFSCATSGGDIWCWGRNDWGQVGVKASAQVVTAPRQLSIKTSHPYERVVGGAAHACALAEDGDLWCWGNNIVSQAVPGSKKKFLTPAQLTFIPPK